MSADVSTAPAFMTTTDAPEQTWIKALVKVLGLTVAWSQAAAMANKTGTKADEAKADEARVLVEAAEADAEAAEADALARY